MSRSPAAVLTVAMIFISCLSGVLCKQDDSIILRPADTSTSVGASIPLSCVATGNHIAQWYKSNEPLTNSTDTRLVVEAYSTERGAMYTISTLVLCNTGLDDTGVYMCGLEGDGHNESFTLNVYIRTTADFQLRLIGINNCGQWNSNESSRINNIQEMTSILRQTVLADVCSTHSQGCDYDIINQGFDCSNDLASIGVTFSATVEHRATVGIPSQNASDVVALIDTWKTTSNQKVTISFQTLSIDPTCEVSSATICSSTGSAQIDLTSTNVYWIVGGAVIGLIFVCITVVIVTVIATKARKTSSTTLSSIVTSDHELAQLEDTQQHPVGDPDTVVTNPAAQANRTLDEPATPNEQQPDMAYSAVHVMYEQDMSNPVYESL